MVIGASDTIPRAHLEIKTNWCKGCNLCVEACPRGVLLLNEVGKVQVKLPERCTGCGLCEAICPDFVIKVIKDA